MPGPESQLYCLCHPLKPHPACVSTKVDNYGLTIPVAAREQVRHIPSSSRQILDSLMSCSTWSVKSLRGASHWVVRQRATGHREGGPARRDHYGGSARTCETLRAGTSEMTYTESAAAEQTLKRGLGCPSTYRDTYYLLDAFPGNSGLAGDFGYPTSF